MKRQRTDEPVDLVSDESSSSDSDESKPSIDDRVTKPYKEIICEETLMKKAKMYQEYMKEIPIPTTGGSLIPFTSWTELALSMKQLHEQPLHYLTNIRIKQWDQMRLITNDEYTPLDRIIHPRKAEATIWLMEEVHRLTTSHHHLGKLWLSDPMHYLFIDPVFYAFPKPSIGINGGVVESWGNFARYLEKL